MQALQVRTRASSTLVGWVCLAWLGAATPARATGYFIQDLGPLLPPAYTVPGVLGGPGSAAYGINTLGVAAGFAGDSLGDLLPVAWQSPLPTSQGPDFGSALGINGTGHTVGSALQGGGFDALLWDGAGGSTDLGTLGGPWGCATAINDAGTVVGVSNASNVSPAAGGERAFVWNGSGIQDLGGFSSAGEAAARGINSAGTAVGSSVNASGQRRAAEWSGGPPLDLGTLGGDNAEAFGINTSGQVVGGADLATEDSHAFLWSPGGGMSDLGTLAGGSYSLALGINDAGQIVGLSTTDPDNPTAGVDHAVTWNGPGPPQDLNLMIPPGSGWLLLQATAIDPQGRIVGFGVNPNGDTHGFLLTPQNVTGVEIAGLSATWSGARRAVELRWEYYGSPGASFRVERRVVAEEEFSPVAGGVGRPDGSEITFEDASVASGAAYQYRVAVTAAGRAFFSGITGVSVPRYALELHPVTPDPATTGARIDFELPGAGSVRIEVYDLRGGRVRVLLDGRLASGPGSVAWDGRDGAGRPAPAGTYFVRLRWGATSLSRKVAVVH